MKNTEQDYVGISFEGLPMPPSSNNQYIQRGRFRVPSLELREFKAEFERVAREREIAFSKAAKLIAEWGALEVHCVFYFPFEKLFTKKSTVKRLDVSNRIKAIHDCLSDAIKRDDADFFLISAEKRVTEEEAYVDVTISPYGSQASDVSHQH